MSLKEIAEEFLHLCATGQARQAFSQFASPHFIHHNPGFASDAEALIAGMEENARNHPNKVLEIQRSVAEGELVAVHSRVTLTDKSEEPLIAQTTNLAVVHIFQFYQGKIAELWDIGQPTPATSANELGMF